LLALRALAFEHVAVVCSVTLCGAAGRRVAGSLSSEVVGAENLRLRLRTDGKAVRRRDNCGERGSIGVAARAGRGTGRCLCPSRQRLEVSIQNHQTFAAGERTCQMARETNQEPDAGEKFFAGSAFHAR
jgi:hypothetical protein